MHELAVLVIVVAVLMAATTIIVGRIGRLLYFVEIGLVVASAAVAVFVMVFVGTEVLMRYFLNSPIPGHLELSELLMPIIVFLALSYTQATRGHVGMDLVLDMLAPTARRYATMGTLLISILVCSVLAYFGLKNAYQLWLYDDVTMSPPYFRTWPSGLAIGIGYFLICIRMYIQLLHVHAPGRFPANEPESGFHAVE